MKFRKKWANFDGNATQALPPPVFKTFSIRF